MELRKLKIDQEIDREDLEELLRVLRYQKIDHVLKPGEFARRGAIFDIYPMTYRNPVRLEFEADRISSIRDFSTNDGKSMASFEEVFLVPVTETLEKKMNRLTRDYQDFEPLTKLKDLHPGDYVVHLKYGIGRFLGTKMIQVKSERLRHMAIEYANKEIIYIETHEPLERYIGGEGRTPKLTKLHGKEWENLKDKTRRAVANIAQEMLVIQAKRSMGHGFSFPPDHPWQKTFEDNFPFEETPDQEKAIRDVKKDMESERPMDRLLAGDVGYGKTEVAIRAAFKAVTAGRQAAVLVPTTVLAEQHFHVFKKRMKDFPVTVEVMSRFQSGKDLKNITESVKQGTTDIVIGTHRLLSKDVQFKDLGILIIDEEQRFGVKHKDRLKQMREMVDILTLTATPIPRTLYMSLLGVRDMSAINTPPKMRMPVETYVLEYNDQTIKRAFERELARSGQVYFIHNRVASIEKIKAHLQELLPEVRFGVAHGQMHADELEMVMDAFEEKKIDCLLATNIIESGIDIPNVNTIFVNRADLFGLADLYQLRGRVGRYHEKRQAYAYFMVPQNFVMPRDAEKRLAAIERFTELGSGFKIALEDLEIRGAGNLLGHEQSGFIHAVGFDLYCKMLKTAIEEAKKGHKIRP